jgi:uncharacterized protein (TIGR04141 family)
MAEQEDQADEKALAEIAQISFFLAKVGRTFETIFDKDKVHEMPRGTRTHEFKFDDVDCKFFYFTISTNKKNPPWLDFINEQLSEKDRIGFAVNSTSPNGILLLNIKGRILVTSFGRSAGSYLERRAFEPDFGIKTAMNMCGNEEIRQTKSSSNTILPTLIDRQTSQPTDTFAFGLSEAEDLKFISAHMRGKSNVTLQGRDSLTIKLIGKEKLDWKSLIATSKDFLNNFESKDYEKLFPNFSNLHLARDEDAEKLDARLLGLLKKEQFANISLNIPEIIPGDEYSFSYTNHAKADNNIYSFLDVTQLPAALKLEKLTVAILREKRLFAYSHAEDRIISSKWWYVYDCINYETELDGKYFVLFGGNWSEVAGEFYKSIENFIAKDVHVEPHEPLCEGIDIWDKVQLKNREGIFNQEYCKRNPTSIHFDTAKLGIGTGRKDKEFCDILDLTDDGLIRIINCKPSSNASSINYLFSQAKFYSDAFLHDATFLKEIRHHIKKSQSVKKDDYLTIISPILREHRSDKFRICLWILYNKKEKPPTKEDMPIIAKYELKLMHDHLLEFCKFREIFLRFIPVQMTKSIKAKSPRKKA